jgi:cysteinyl-tRNA synthetase
MYSCGPTVHDYAHIGNFRTFVFMDILQRTLRARGYDLRYIMNITDIDDKTIVKSNAAGLSLAEFTEKYTAAFFEDFDTLRIQRPDVICKATDHIPEMTKLVQALLDRGMAYVSDSSVYFKIAAFPEYGKLSKKDFDGLRSGARVDVDEYDKENARDFVLWKGKKEGEPYWETSFGDGRPGWHLECSAMSMAYGGQTLDIHCGGADLVFPHHENEIAQSEGATGEPFVRFWLHSEYLIVNGEKMSKSKGNFYTLRDLTEKGHDPAAIRYLLMSTHYRKQLNFTEEGVRQAQAALDRIHEFVDNLGRRKLPAGDHRDMTDLCDAAARRFDEALDDDINTAAAQAALFDFIRDVNRRLDAGEVGEADRAKVMAFIEKMDAVFDILPAADAAAEADADIAALVKQREEARRTKNWAEADRIRDELAARGVTIKDTPEGTVWKKN